MLCINLGFLCTIISRCTVKKYEIIILVVVVVVEVIVAVVKVVVEVEVVVVMILLLVVVMILVVVVMIVVVVAVVVVVVVVISNCRNSLHIPKWTEVPGSVCYSKKLYEGKHRCQPTLL